MKYICTNKKQRIMKKYWIKSIKEIVNIRFNGFLSSEYIEYCGFYFEDVLVENELMGVFKDIK